MSVDSSGKSAPEISAEVRSFIDRVIVPALVDRFNAERCNGISSPVITPQAGNPPSVPMARRDKGGSAEARP